MKPFSQRPISDVSSSEGFKRQRFQVEAGTPRVVGSLGHSELGNGDLRGFSSPGLIQTSYKTKIINWSRLKNLAARLLDFLSSSLASLFTPTELWPGSISGLRGCWGLEGLSASPSFLISSTPWTIATRAQDFTLARPITGSSHQTPVLSTSVVRWDVNAPLCCSPKEG